MEIMSNREEIAQFPCATSWPKTVAYGHAGIRVYRDDDTKTFRLFVDTPNAECAVTASFTREDALKLGQALLDSARGKWFAL
jgi:hypothetical protein